MPGARAILIGCLFLGACTSEPSAPTPSAHRPTTPRTPRASVSAGGNVRIELGELAIERVILDASGQKLLVLDESGAIDLFDAASGKLIQVARPASTDDVIVSDVELSADGASIAWCTDFDDSCRAHVVDVATGRETISVAARDGERLRGLVFSADGAHLAVTSYENRVCIVDVVARVASRWSDARAGSPVDLGFDPRDARRLCVLSSDGARTTIVHSDDVTMGVQTPHDLPAIEAIAYTSRGPLALAHVELGSSALVVHDGATGRALATLNRTFRTVVGAGFSPDGSRLVIGGPDGTLELWDWARARVLATEELGDVVFSGDSSLLAGVGPEARVIVMRTDDGSAFESIDVPDEDDVTALALDQHGDRLAVGTASGVVHVWRLAH